MSDFLEQMAFCPDRRTWTGSRTLRAKEPSAAMVTSNDRSASCCCKLSALMSHAHALVRCLDEGDGVESWRKKVEPDKSGRRDG